VDHKIDSSCLSSHFHHRIPSSHNPHCFTKCKKYFASLLPEMDRMAFAKANPTMQKVLNLEQSSFQFAHSIIYIVFLFSNFLLSWNCVFVFGCVRNIVVALSCFKGFCYCCFLAKFSFNISCCSIVLWVCLCGFNIVAMFMFHCVISMGSVQLYFFLHHVCSYITITPTLSIIVHHKCSYITIVPTLLILLHCKCPCIVIALASLIFLCHKCSCIAIVRTLLIFIQHGILFFWCNLCYFYFLCFLEVFQFCDYNHTNIAHAIVSCRDVYLGVFLTSSVCFVVCIDFNVGLFFLQN
jgi:hypothetical protein